MLLEPLTRFFQEFGFDSDEIKALVFGEKYLAVLLHSGQIGVCARLNTHFDTSLNHLTEVDLRIQSHRVLYQAYLNARFNYHKVYSDTGDIFDEIDFSRCKKIVMVGYFKPLAKKFIEAEIELSIFDKVHNDPVLTPYPQMANHLRDAQHVILTATSVFNSTFLDVINQTPDGTSIYLLGPSSLLHPMMFDYPNIKKVYGSVFLRDDHRILELIAEGKGTRSFLPLGRKVYLIKT